MGADNEIAMVFNEDDQKWYVNIVFAGNIIYAIKWGKSFINKSDAMEYALDLAYKNYTEYGVNIY